MISLVDVDASVIVDSSGRTIEIPALLTQYGPLDVLIEYFCKHHRIRGISWMLKRRRALRALLQYISVNPFEARPEKLFQNFAQALQTGTFNLCSGIDESGLCWLPRTDAVSQEIVSGLTDFFGWLNEEYEMDLNPNPPGHVGTFDRIVCEAAYQYRRSRAFLGHSWAVNSTSSSQKIVGAKTRIRLAATAEGRSAAFPEAYFWDLLFKGFNVCGKLNYRDILITLLMNGAGFRSSEPFHLFASDVSVDPDNINSALVYIHHPSQGGVPIHIDTMLAAATNREGYLLSRYGLLPRNMINGTDHAGWKGGKHEKFDRVKVLRANWFLPAMGEVFLDIWNIYLAQIASLDRHHPFVFVNIEAGQIGEMYKPKAFRDAHRRAVLRIGLPVSKADGTTEHGHRHAYAQRLVEGGVEPAIRQRCMHHASIHSQDVYTQPGTADVLKQLRIAGEKLSESNRVLNIRREDLRALA